MKESDHHVVIFNSTPASAVSVSATHQNTDQEVVVITIDRLTLAIHEHRACVSDSNAWWTPLGSVDEFTLDTGKQR